MILKFILVGIGGAAGSMLRYGISQLFQTLSISGNMATFVVNAVGSLLIGYITGAVHEAAWLLLLTTGFCGGFTTFSTFSLQSVNLMQEGRFWSAALYCIGSVLVCILFAAAGLYLSGKFKTV